MLDQLLIALLAIAPASAPPSGAPMQCAPATCAAPSVSARALVTPAARDEIADTCTIEFARSVRDIRCREGMRVRLLLVDAPSGGPTGFRAQRALRALLRPGTVTRVEIDRSGVVEDGSRVLAYLWLPDGRMVNEVLARTGHAFLHVVLPNVRYAPELREASRQAQERRAGLWRDARYAVLAERMLTAVASFDFTPAERREGFCLDLCP
jgi:endonuclease YncB( thermonuclease family)